MKGGLYDTIIEVGMCQLRNKSLYDASGHAKSAKLSCATRDVLGRQGFALLSLDALPTCRRVQDKKGGYHCYGGEL